MSKRLILLCTFSPAGLGEKKSWQFVKGTRQIPWKRVKFRWETVRLFQAEESRVEKALCFLMATCEYVVPQGRVNRLLAKAGQSQDVGKGPSIYDVHTEGVRPMWTGE